MGVSGHPPHGLAEVSRSLGGGGRPSCELPHPHPPERQGLLSVQVLQDQQICPGEVGVNWQEQGKTHLSRAGSDAP